MFVDVQISPMANPHVSYLDFGLSKHFKFGEVQNEAVGTPYTVAPEVIKGSYDERCDIWAIGVITYLLLSGDPPFGGCGGPEPLLTVRANILNGTFAFEPEEIWSIVSSQARDFISNVLVTDPKHRPTARESQKHPWLREWATRGMKQGDHRLNPNVVKALVSFKEFSDMRKLLCEVLSFTLLPEQIKDLRKEFEKMDTDGSGEISLEALKQVLMTNAGAGSLGALTETEVEDIFNAMRVRKTETRIHWHEFIAAGLSQCQVDDRNLRLAFDRLDSDHKGYITFENVTDLMGTEAIQSEDAMRQMWGDSMKACNCHHARITYDDFLLLMKGQTRETDVSETSQQMLQVVHEANPSEEGEAKMENIQSGDTTKDALEADGPADAATLKRTGSGVGVRRNSWASTSMLTSSRSLDRSLASPPITPLFNQGVMSQMPEIDLPLSMDDDDDDDVPQMTDPAASQVFKSVSNCFTPPQSPQRGAADYVTPLSERKGVPVVPNLAALGIPEFPKKPAPYTRRRSRSVDDQDPDVDDTDVPSFGADARRAMLLPEHDRAQESTSTVEKKTALFVNRQLYRAHRQMRQAVLDATKRFDEQQAIRARDMLASQGGGEGGEEVGPVGAGLVLRHGPKKTLSSEAVRNWMKKTKEEQEALVQKASKRGGRGKSRRKKTISDMTGMLAGLQSDLNQTSGISQSQPFTAVDGKDAGNRGSVKMGESDSALDIPGVEDVNIEDFPPVRDPTVPGVFHKTVDPFASGGRYGF